MKRICLSMNTINKKKNLKLLLLGIIVMTFCFVIDRESHKENQKIFNNPKYAIGELTSFSKSKNGISTSIVVVSPRATEIRYKYNVDGINFKYVYTANFYSVPTSGLKIGDKYLVICSKIDPQQSRMLFDYPIKDSTDFIRYLEKLKKNPPKMRE